MSDYVLVPRERRLKCFRCSGTGRLPVGNWTCPDLTDPCPYCASGTVITTLIDTRDAPAHCDDLLKAWQELERESANMIKHCDSCGGNGKAFGNPTIVIKCPICCGVRDALARLSAAREVKL